METPRAFAIFAIISTSTNNYTKCLFVKALPDPDFKYFSKLNALYLSLKAK